MKLIDKIKSDIIKSRINKDSDKLALLTTLMSEISRIGKDSSQRDPNDDDALLAIQKFIKDIKITKEILEKNGKSPDKQLAELEVLLVYLPKQLTIDDLYKVWDDYVKESLDKNLTPSFKDAMKYIKVNYPNQYEGKAASILFTGLSNNL